MIDAEYRSEERFAKLSLAYTTDDEKQKVLKCVDEITAKYDAQPETYTCDISDGKREVLVIEYHDDMDRASGPIFEEIMKELHITNCD